MSTQGTGYDRFIDSLERFAGKGDAGDYDPRRQNSAALARLRRGLGREPMECSEMLSYVMPFLPEVGKRDHYFLVASIFAHHPPTDRHTGLSLGAAIHAVWQERDRIDSIEKRFVALLNAHGDELPHHLRQIIGLVNAQQRPTPLDYRKLLQHLAHWDNPSRWVQMEWARDFWGHKPDPATDESDTPAMPTEND